MYFDESAVSVVDSWLAKGPSAAGTKNIETAAAEAAVPTGRGGIGFKSTKKASKEDGFENGLRKIAAKKKRDELEQSRQTVELHGVVEEEFEKVKRPKVAEQKNTAVALPSKPNNTQSSGSKALTPVANAADRSTSSIKPPTGDPNTEPGGSVKRQRKKTRSKQKNIRKDNRATNFKPEHLQLGNKSYSGRPLTKVMKVVMCMSGRNVFYFIFPYTGNKNQARSSCR